MRKQEYIYSVLKNEIISGTLPSDTPLREIEVSRTPIREVLRQLAVEKLIRIIPNSGAYVGAFTWEEATEVFEVRQGLESFAAGLAAARISNDAIAKLEALYAEKKKLRAANGGIIPEHFSRRERDHYSVLTEWKKVSRKQQGPRRYY